MLFTMQSFTSVHRWEPGGFFALFLVSVALWVVSLVFWTPSALAQTLSEKNFTPGFGIIYGEGTTDNGAESRRVGFTSRRLSDGGRTGSLALMGEENFNGVPFTVLGAGLSPDAVTLHYQSIFVEMKRYFSISERFNYYWALRGGYTRITGRIERGGSEPAVTFQEDSIAPLALLALPFALENPGFLMLAFVDGTSLGLTFDVVPNRIWLDYQIGTAISPTYRSDQLVIENLMLPSQSLQLAIVF